MISGFTYATDPIEVDEWRNFEVHEYCAVFPRMPDDEFEDLRQSIIGMGLRLPIILYEGKVLDGRHRYQICLDEDIEPRFEQYMGPGSAADYVLDMNMHRRHLSAAQRLKVVVDIGEIGVQRMLNRERSDANLKRGSDIPRGGGAPTSGGGDTVIRFPGEKTRDKIAKKAKVDPRTAEDYLKIREYGTPEDIDEVESGKTGIERKAKEIRKRQAEKRDKEKAEQEAPVTLEAWNSMDEDARSAALLKQGKMGINEQKDESIGWARWSWNPVSGCLHGCAYCYARDIANRFYSHGFVPAVYPSRLAAFKKSTPRASDNPAEKNVFVCSMADLFGRWVPEEWIEAVMDSVRRAPDWNFLFLTKFPKRMIERDVPKNAWLGTTVDSQSRVKTVEDIFERIPAHTKWLSLEPLLEPLKFTRPELFQWVAIGGASRSTATPEWAPPFEWVADLTLQFKRAGVAVYHKSNIGFSGPRILREFPWQKRHEENAPEQFKFTRNY